MIAEAYSRDCNACKNETQRGSTSCLNCKMGMVNNFTPMPVLVTRKVEKPALDKQIGGIHYLNAGSNMQPWSIITAWGLGYYRGNVLKYLLRAPQKNGIEDIEKAIHYLEYIKANYNELKEKGLL
jgi:hypothetical protein